LQLSVHKAMGK